MQTNVIVAAVIGILLLGGGFFYWKNMEPPIEEIPPIEEPVEQLPVLNTYASTTANFSLQYDPKWSAVPDYINLAFGEKKPVAGFKLTVPTDMATGTNLSADSGISVEVLPRANKCTGDIYLKANVKAEAKEENGIQYSVASSTEGAAGNKYEEIVYALPSSSPCTAVRYFIHSTTVQNYPEGTVREFDRAILLAEFDKIRQSVMLGQEQQNGTSTSTTN